MKHEKLGSSIQILENHNNDSGDEMISAVFFKRRYYDMRLGGTMISPIIQLVNFAMIAFLYIRLYIPIEIFGPLFVISGFVALSYIGVRFRKHQASTDYNMLFEKQTQQAKIFYHIMLAIKTGVISKEFDEQLEYLKRVSED